MKDLEILNKKGWILGPKEEEKDFSKRIKALDHFFSFPPEDIDNFLTDTDWKTAQKKTEYLYDFSADWILAHYSDKNLSFFQGAATWITKENEITVPIIQLRKRFEQGNLLRMYRKDEVLAHETIHAARMEFDEPYFEEIFAYQTSPYSWRRFFGPIFQKSWEIYLLILLLFIPIGLEIAEFVSFDIEHWSLLKYLPLVFFLALFSRLLFLQITLRIALQRIKKILRKPEKNWAVCFRLKDREIFRFAYLRKKQNSEYIKKQTSFRWKFLKKNYFNI